MIGILVTSYGELPGALTQTLEAILGSQEALESVAVMPGDSREDIAEHLQSTVERLHQECDGVLVLTGVYGESDCTLCQSLFNRKTVKIVTGVNLPMLFKALTYRASLSLDELARYACQGGRDGIRVVEPSPCS